MDINIPITRWSAPHRAYTKNAWGTYELPSEGKATSISYVNEKATSTGQFNQRPHLSASSKATSIGQLNQRPHQLAQSKATFIG